VVLIDADPAMANRIAQRMQRALRDGRERPALSVSIGISIYPEDGRSAPELLEAADPHRRLNSSRNAPTNNTADDLSHPPVSLTYSVAQPKIRFVCRTGANTVPSFRADFCMVSGGARCQAP
jgi:hypothetical protein